MALKRMSGKELDLLAACLAEAEEKVEELRAIVKAQVSEFGFRPSGAEKSLRIETTLWQFTVSTSSTTEVRDSEVQRIATACEPELFNQLFRAQITYKLANGASMLLARTLPAGAPVGLRQMFAKAVMTKESKPRLRIEPLHAEEHAAVQ